MLDNNSVHQHKEGICKTKQRYSTLVCSPLYFFIEFEVLFNFFINLSNEHPSHTVMIIILQSNYLSKIQSMNSHITNMLVATFLIKAS